MGKAITRGFLRVKVLIDSRKPFSTSFWLPRSAHQSFHVEYCYEGLGDFCYVCGLLGHCENACKGSSESIRTLSENSWMKRCLPPIYPPLPLEQLNRAGRRRPPSARITRSDHATTTNLVEATLQPLTTNPERPVEQSLSLDGDNIATVPLIIAVTEQSTIVSATPPDITDAATNGHLNAYILNRLSPRTLVSPSTEELRQRFLPVGCPSSNAYERAMILALTYRG